VPVRIFRFAADATEAIRSYSSVSASALALGHGEGASHVYAVHIEPGGEIGPHPAGFDQFFLVVQGSGWIAGADGIRHLLPALHGAFVPKGETHAKGSEAGMVAIMVQATSFAP
jgi:quercetin dioxygenase-like cupin family protein